MRPTSDLIRVRDDMLLLLLLFPFFFLQETDLLAPQLVMPIPLAILMPLIAPVEATVTIRGKSHALVEEM